MERKEVIRGAYRMTGGNNFYDGMITCSTLSGKAVCRLVWAMNKAENNAYREKALSGIPEHFSGKLLEVPVGTGILTMPVYQTMPEADITCLDYSPDMMRQARENCRAVLSCNGCDRSEQRTDCEVFAGSIFLHLAHLHRLLRGAEICQQTGRNTAGGGLSASAGRGAAGDGGRFFHRCRPCHGVSDADEAARGARFL